MIMATVYCMVHGYMDGYNYCPKCLVMRPTQPPGDERMTTDYRTEMLLLEMRNAIAEKESLIAQANRQQALDGWLCDWAHEIARCDAEARSLAAAIRERLEQ